MVHFDPYRKKRKYRFFFLEAEKSSMRILMGHKSGKFPPNVGKLEALIAVRLASSQRFCK